MKLTKLYSVADEGARFVCAVKAAYDMGWRGMKKEESEARYIFTNMTGRMVACAGVGYYVAEDFGCMIGMLAGAVWFGAEWVAGVYLHEYDHPPVRPKRKPVELERIVRRAFWDKKKKKIRLVEVKRTVVETLDGRVECVEWE